MSNLLSLLSEKPIAYHKPLIRKFGLAPGVFLGQLLYWQGKGSKGEWIYKTQAEMKEETCLSRRNQETARKKLIAAGVLEEKLVGVPAQLHYRVNLLKLASCLGISSTAEPSATGCTKRANSNGGTEQSITKNTQENTTKRAPTPAPPQIEAIRGVTNRYPPKAIWSDLITACAALNEVKLDKCFRQWVLHGFNPANYSWITDWYVNGIPSAVSKRFPTHAEMNAGGRGKLVI